MKTLFFIILFAAASPDNASLPPAPELWDSLGVRWVLGDNANKCNPGGMPLCLPTDRLVSCKGEIYGQHRSTLIWWRGIVGNGWLEVGPKHPCE